MLLGTEIETRTHKTRDRTKKSHPCDPTSMFKSAKIGRFSKKEREHKNFLTFAAHMASAKNKGREFGISTDEIYTRCVPISVDRRGVDGHIAACLQLSARVLARLSTRCGVMCRLLFHFPT
jgi:hypothetical protein